MENSLANFPTDGNDNALIVYQDEDRRLKHLDFVQTTVENMVILMTSLYELAKNHSGTLKPRVDSLEEAIKNILGPVCNQFYYVPFHLLQLLDRKVDESIHEVDWHHDPLPVLLRHVAEKAPEVLHDIAVEIHRSGLIDATVVAAKEAYITYKPVVKELLYKHEPVAEEYAVWAWRLCMQLPIVAQVAQIMVPAGIFWAERYNEALELTREGGFQVAGYLPPIPIEKIAQVFAEEASEDDEVSNAIQYTNEGDEGSNAIQYTPISGICENETAEDY